MQRALQGATRLDKHDQILRAMQVRIAVDSVIAGTADRDAWSFAFDAINLIERLCRDPQIATGAEEFVDALQQCVVRIIDRGNVIEPNDAALLQDAVALYAELLGRVTYRQLFDAENAVNAAVRAALAGAPSPDVRVIAA